MDYEKFKQKFPLNEKEESGEKESDEKEVKDDGKKEKKLSKSKIELHPKLDQESY